MSKKAVKTIGNRARVETRIIKSRMETTDSGSLILGIYVAQAEATCSFVICPSQKETGKDFLKDILFHLQHSYCDHDPWI